MPRTARQSSQRPPTPGSAEPDFDLRRATAEHYDDAALYDFEYRRRRADVTYYRALAGRHPGGVLELGCGSGRLLIPLARDGHRVVGLDLSRSMLARAALRRARLPPTTGKRIVLLRADLRCFALRRRFPLIICGFNTFQHLYARTDVEQALLAVRNHLAPDGRFAIDLLNPDPAWLARDPKRRWARTRFAHPETGHRFVYSTNHVYDTATQIALIRMYYEPVTPDERGATARIVHLAHRQFFPQELEALLRYSGFRISSRRGGFNGQPFVSESEAQVIIASCDI